MSRGVWTSSAFIWGTYGVALAMPVLTANVDGYHASLFGYEALLCGWDWPGTIPECANLALIAGWVSLIRRRAVASACGIAAVGLALSAPSIYSDASHPGWRDWFWRVSDVSASVDVTHNPVHLGWGYWLWLASMLQLLVYCISQGAKECHWKSGP